MYNKDLDFRYAKREDTALILQFIKELADYEKMLNEVVADEKTLEEWIFDKQKAMHSEITIRDVNFPRKLCKSTTLSIRCINAGRFACR